MVSAKISEVNGTFYVILRLELADSPRTVDLGVSVFTMFKMKYLVFPWFDFLHSWYSKDKYISFKFAGMMPVVPRYFPSLDWPLN